MSKTTFLGYVPSLKAKHEATIVEGKAIESKGGSIRYTLRGEYDGRKTLPKTVSKADFENVYGFDAKEAEGVLIVGKKDGQAHSITHNVGETDKTGFTPMKGGILTTDEPIGEHLKDDSLNYQSDTVGEPSPASVEPPAPSDTPFPQEPSNENFSAENVRTGITDDGKTAYEWYVVEGDESITDNNGEPLIRPYDEEEITNEIEYYVNHFVGQGELSDSESLRLHEIVDSHDRFDEPMEYTIAYSWKPVEVKEAFGFGKDDEEEEPEEEKPKEQEFTVVLQEGDKLELTDIEEKEETDEPKDEDNGEDEENDEKEEEDDASEDESEDEENDEKEAESIEVWEMIQQNLNNPDAVREFYRVLVGDPDDFKGDDMSLVVAEVYQQNDNSQEFVDWVHKELFSAEETLDTLIVLRQKAAKEEGLENWKNDSNAGMLSGEIQERIWKHKDFGAECDCEHRTQKDESCWECKSCGEHYTQEFGAELVKDMLMICPSCDETVPEYSSCMACGQQFRSEDFDFVGWIPEADNPDNCFICGKSNQGFEGNDNVCTTCHESWEYDEGGEEGEGYYLKETKRAVSAKVTRPVKEEEKEEEEKEEEGMSTLMKVGLGVGALAVSAAILGAEERVAVMWEGKDDNNNGLIYGIEYYGEDGEFSDVEWFRTADQRDAMLLDSDGESDYWEGENAHWRAEGSGEDFQNMTSSEFVPFDQITAEIQEEWDETTPSISADYEPINEPSNSNFSAEDDECSCNLNRDSLVWVDYDQKGNTISTTLSDLTNALHHYEREGKLSPSYQIRHDGCEKHMDKGEIWNLPFMAENFSAEEMAQCQGCGEMEYANIMFHSRRGHNCFTCFQEKIYPNLTEREQMHYLPYMERFDANTVGSPSPSGPSSVPEPAEATGSEPSNEHMEAETDNMKWVLGITAVGIGLAAVLGKDKLTKLFDRFGL